MSAINRATLAAMFLAVGAGDAYAAQGQDRKTSLENQPAVRKRLRLREGRFEVGPAMGVTIGQPFRHTLLAGIKTEYHFLDWFSAGMVFTHRAASFDSGLTKEVDTVNDARLEQECGGLEGAQLARCELRFGIHDEEGASWKAALSETVWTASFRAVFTPFAGKLALFSKFYCPVDAYGIIGLGLVKSENYTDADLQNDDLHAGLNLGLGMHFFFHPSVALSVEFVDTVIRSNPSGRNVNLSVDSSGACTSAKSEDEVATQCDRVNDGDEGISGHYGMLFGVTAYLPFQVKRSR